MFQPLPSKFDFPESEKRVLEFWRQHDVFNESLRQRAAAPRFVFYEGPPTANGLPHPGHCLTRVMKDIFPRYKTMRGFLVERKGGWDTHGLPVEREVCKELTAELGRPMHTKQDIEAYGVEKFNLKCIQSVFRYTREWEEMTRRLAYWVDLKEAYVTFHQSYVESVWWSLKTLFEHRDAHGRPDPLLYLGHKVVWWWAQGGTALSSGEVGEGYRTVDDPSVFVKFPIPGSIGVPPVPSAQSPGSIGVPPVSSAQSPGSIGVPPVSSAQSPGSIGVPPVPSAQSPGSIGVPPVPSAQSPGSIGVPPVPSAQSTGSIGVPPVSSMPSTGSIGVPPVSSMPSTGSIGVPPVPSAQSPGSIGVPPVPSAQSPGSIGVPPVPSAPSPGSIGVPPVSSMPSTGSIGVPPVSSMPSTGSIGVPPVRTPESGHRGVLKSRVGPTLSTRSRILPHWESGGSTYFFTFRLLGGELTDDERTIVLNACQHWDSQRILLHAAVVMPDHAHVLCTPLEKSKGEWWSIADLMHSIKGFSAKEINRLRGTSGLVWQREYYDRIIRSPDDFEEKWNYIVTNPVRRGLPETYPWVWVEVSHARSPGSIGVPPVNSGEVSHRRDADAPHSLSHQQPATSEQTQMLAHRRDADAPRRVSLLVWTTTPWTLVSNHFAAVHPDLEYALVHDPVDDEHLYIAAALVETIAKKVKRELRVVATCKGVDLVGLAYLPPFPEVYHDAMHARRAALTTGGEASIGWRVTAADFVTIESGSGLVHEAPAFGEVDFNLLQQERERFIDRDAIRLICAVAPDGSFNDEAPQRYRGRWVKDCDKEIVRELRDERKTPWGTPLLYHQEQYRHDYPFCPQSPDDPLIQYARKGWFVRTSQFKDEFLKNNAGVNWLPEHIKEGRFGDFLRNNVDWALSRERYWGTPLPIWVCEACGNMEAIGSFAELQSKPGATDASPEYPQGYWNAKVAEHKGEEFPAHLRVHKPYIDEWRYRCAACEGAGNREQGTEGTQGRRDAGTKENLSMRRVPEVIDCWWDAGSMPFAQWGFPHADGSAALFEQRFPADFISEAIDQTRGWFYGLLAISTLLFNHRDAATSLATGALAITPGGPDTRVAHRGGVLAPYRFAERAQYPLPFRTCIVLGHIMGEDGNKMSKKLRNYKEPSYIFDTLGADAMRWYFLSAQAPWTSTRFAEAAIRDSQREFLVKLYNVMSFFTIYASIDGFDPRRRDEPGNPMAWRPTEQRGELDRWIVTELRRTIAAARESMDRFENYPAAQRLNDFVDALSNWYVRRSRDRFWRPFEGAKPRSREARQGMANGAVAEPFKASSLRGSVADSDQEKWDAYHTLYGCLRTLSRLIAPFTPFFAETMHQYLRVTADPLSVHLCDYPAPDDVTYHDDDLAATMETVRDLVTLGRAARAGAKLKVRQPLALVELILARPGEAGAIRDHAALISEELNVKRVELVDEADKYVTYKVVPNFKAIGAKFRELVPKLKEALGRISDAAAARRALLETGSLPVALGDQTLHLTVEEVEIRLEAKPGWSAAQGKAGVVVVSTELTPELIDEGLIRELIHHVQALRKERELAYEARIVLFIETSPEFRRVVDRFAEIVRGECLVRRIEWSVPAGESCVEVQVDRHSARLALRTEES
ncbi:MAG: Isoleucine--tRNA ligase [Phycisphaerae bacterium]|nr:Isoleucine--tRNA ligase [Phycisphaerae bacterium]